MGQGSGVGERRRQVEQWERSVASSLVVAAIASSCTNTSPGMHMLTLDIYIFNIKRFSSMIKSK